MAQGTGTIEAIVGKDTKPTLVGTRYIGVYPSGNTQKPWKSQISIRGKSVVLGTFASEVEAAQAYDAKARAIGRTKSLNFPDVILTSPGTKPERKTARGTARLRRAGPDVPARDPQQSELTREVEIIRRVGEELEGLDKASAQRVLIYIASFFE